MSIIHQPVKCTQIKMVLGRLKYYWFLKWANPCLFFAYFCPFHTTNQLQIEKA